MGYVTDIRHYLNEEGEIPDVLPQEARELASFVLLVIDAVTTSYPDPRWSIETKITCLTKGCTGEVIGALDTVQDPIHWYCLDCGELGIISGWRESRWNNAANCKA